LLRRLRLRLHLVNFSAVEYPMTRLAPLRPRRLYCYSGTSVLHYSVLLYLRGTTR
jgi:hypothetical protein